MASVSENQIQIEYDTFGDPASPALLLIMGLGGQLIHWQEAFCRQISEAGYRVIRYDNRDTGFSTKFEGLNPEEVVDKAGALIAGKDVSVPYTLEDMADDALGLLDALNIEAAHMAGMSMGGMIAQTFAIRNPSRTLSLTSIYSHSGKWQDVSATQGALEALMAPMPDEREAYVDAAVGFYRLTYGSGLAFDEAFHKNLERRAYDRAFYPEGVGRQTLAILAQKDRTAALGKLAVPALIVHGDADPLVPLSDGRATADAIPGSELVVIKGMGHVVPNVDAFWTDIKDAMLKHMGKAG